MARANCSLLFGVDDAPALGCVLLPHHEARLPLAEQRSQLLLARGGDGACRVKGGGIGDFGGGFLEHPWRWVGAQWPGLSPWECRIAQSCEVQESWGVAGAEARHCRGV